MCALSRSLLWGAVAIRDGLRDRAQFDEVVTAKVEPVELEVAPQLFEVGANVFANDQKSGIYEAKVIEVKYAHPPQAAPKKTKRAAAAQEEEEEAGVPLAPPAAKEWMYKVHFSGWKKSNDLWLPASALVVREDAAANDAPDGDGMGPPKKKRSKGRAQAQQIIIGGDEVEQLAEEVADLNQVCIHSFRRHPRARP